MAEVASAYVTLMPSAKGFGSKLNSEVGGEVDKSGKTLGSRLGSAMKVGALGVLGGVALAGKFLSDSLGEAREAQKIGATTEQIIKSTGKAAGITADQVGDMAGRLSSVTGIDDEVIQQGSNLLLTFKNVKNYVDGEFVGVFDRATAAAVDLSAAGFGSVDGAAKMLGKALNDPIKGISALGRAGVTFTAGQQDQIKALVETGDAAKAQAIILGEVESQVGGVAAASATAGEKAAVAWGNFQEEMGTRLLPVVDRVLTTFTTKGLPAITAFANGVGTFLRPILADVGRIFSTVIVPALVSFITGMQTGTGAGGQFAAVMATTATALNRIATFIQANKAAVGTFVGIIGTAIIVTKAWRAAQFALNIVLAANPIGIVVVAIAALAAGAVIAYKRSATFRGIVDSLWASLKTAGKWLADVAGTAASFAAKIGATAIPKVAALAGLLTGALVGGIRAAIGVIGSIIGKVGEFGTALVNGAQKAGQFLTGVQQKVGAALTVIQGIPARVVAIFTGAGAAMYNAGAQLMGQLAAGITAKIGDAIAAAQAGLSRLKGLLPGSPIKWGPLKNWNQGGAGKRLMGLVEKGITAATPKTVKAAKSAFDKIAESLEATRDRLKGTLDGLKGDFEGIKDSVASAFTGNLFDVGATEAKDAVFEMIDGKSVETEVAVAGRSVGQNFVDNLMGKKAELTGLLASFKTLTGWGIDPGFLTQLFSSGNGALITEIAGMGKAGALDTASLFGEVTNLGNQLGTAVAQNDPVADRIDETNRLLTIATEQLAYLGSDIGKELNQAASKAQRDKKKRGKK